MPLPRVNEATRRLNPHLFGPATLGADPVKSASKVRTRPALSAQEQIQEAFFRSHGLPEFVTEHQFAPPRRWRFDFAWPEHKIALEVEGGVWTEGRHTRGKGFLDDVEKYNEAVCLGWRVVRTVPTELLTAPTVTMIFRLLPIKG